MQKAITRRVGMGTDRIQNWFMILKHRRVSEVLLKPSHIRVACEFLGQDVKSFAI